MSRPELYGYWRSSASYRVRIALALKGIAYVSQPVNLLSAAHRDASYAEVNPQQFVPAYRTPEGKLLAQSLAIIEYLEETYPTPAILPADAWARAQARALAQVIACDIHPINNLRILKYLSGELHVNDEQKSAWIRHWLAEGLNAFEALLAQSATPGPCCLGNAPTLADICLIPQLYNARRFNLSLESYPLIRRVEEHCLALPAFAAAHPDRQPDALKPA